MKKILVVAALFASMAAASAQQFGVIGGLSLSTMDGAKNPDENKLMTLYQAGVAFKADLGAGFAIQPTLSYSVKGANLKQNNDVVSKTGFAELSVGLQWGPDLLAFRPYLFVEPFVGYGVTGSEILRMSGTETTVASINKALDEAKNKLEYGVGAGLGVEIASHIQLSCQLFRNFGPLYKADSLNTGDLKDIKSSYVDLKNYQGVKINLAILF
ncbi:MAG: PorT family protein [Bacteroidales bacterium]|nr:PorT family protein [Bacteroidales bacterium]